MNGQADTRPDKRRYLRTDASFLVIYRLDEIPGRYYIRESCNLGQGGMLLTTATRIAVGDQLLMDVRFPFTFLIYP